MKDKNLMVIKKNIFKKIINFFKNIFNKDALEENGENAETLIKNEINTEKSIFGDLSIDKSYDLELLKIQQRYENGEIEFLDFSDSEYESLLELYNSQIKDLEKSIENKKTEINMLLFKENGYIPPQ